MLLARNVYRVTEAFPRAEQFGLTAQMRRSAVSVPSNIAEGHGRLTDKSFRLFLAQARGSLYELQTQLQLSADLGFCTGETASSLSADAVEVAKIINGLIRSLHRQQQNDIG